MENNHMLIKYYSNWADEFDVEGYIVVTKEEYEKFVRKLESIKNFTFVFGTNEDIYYDSNLNLKYDLKFIPITGVEYDSLKRLDLLEVGINPYSQIMDYDYEHEEDFEEKFDYETEPIAKPTSGIILNLSSSQLKQYSTTTKESQREEN